MNRLSFNHFARSDWFGCTPDLPGAIGAAANAGFTYFAPDCGSLSSWLIEGHELPELSRHMADAGIACAALAASGMLDGGSSALDGLREAARMGVALGAQFLQVNLAAPDPSSRVAAIRDACAAIDGSGLKLAIEYLPFTPLRTLAETIKIVGIVGLDRAGALVDIWHHSHDPDGWETLAAAPLDAIAYVEFDDALTPLSSDLLVETMERRTFPGEGVLEVDRFAQLLRSRGYEGIVSVEVLNRELAQTTLADFVMRCGASAHRYWS
jgi:sugar phosphate isomerase/epimerase